MFYTLCIIKRIAHGLHTQQPIPSSLYINWYAYLSFNSINTRTQINANVKIPIFIIILHIENLCRNAVIMFFVRKSVCVCVSRWSWWSHINLVYKCNGLCYTDTISFWVAMQKHQNRKGERERRGKKQQQQYRCNYQNTCPHVVNL